MPEKHPLTSYGLDLCLKINDTMWLVLLFLLRPYVIVIASLVNRKDRMGMINLFYSDRTSLMLGILAGIPAAIVIYAWIKKKSGAPSWIKRVWHRGKELLAIAAIFNALIVFVPLWMGSIHKISALGWTQFAVSVGIVPALYFSGYIKDCFADYPEEQEEGAA